MGPELIEGIIVTPLKRIPNLKGDILHAIRKSDKGFNGFGEAYFSTIRCGEIKGWKKHTLMTMNIVVLIGTIRFVIYDDRTSSSTHGYFNEFIIGEKNYQRITIPPGLWVAFQGVGREINYLLNIANLEHDPQEAVNISLSEINFNWL